MVPAEPAPRPRTYKPERFLGNFEWGHCLRFFLPISHRRSRGTLATLPAVCSRFRDQVVPVTLGFMREWEYRRRDEKRVNLVVATVMRWSCHNLRRISLAGCYYTESPAVLALAAACPRLTSLDLTTCWRLTDEAVVALGTACTGLTSLNLSDCNKVTDDALAVVARGCPLAELRLSGCWRVSDGTALALAGECGGTLTSLHLDRCHRISLPALLVLLKASPAARLQALSLADYCALTDEVVATAAAACPSLTLLHLPRCSKITDAAVCTLRAACPALTSLDLSCTRVTDAALNGIAEGFPELQFVAVNGCWGVSRGAVAAFIRQRCFRRDPSRPRVSIQSDGCGRDADGYPFGHSVRRHGGRLLLRRLAMPALLAAEARM